MICCRLTRTRCSPQWEVRFSNSRQRPYFYNEGQGISIWEPPTGLSDEELLALPGAHENLHRQPEDSVQASHILIKHSGSRRPSSWKEVRELTIHKLCDRVLAYFHAYMVQKNITRSKEEALTELQAIQEQLRSATPEEMPALFAQIATTESHCSSHSHGGDLGPFKRGQMQKPFEDTSFSLPVGGLSDIIETDSGVHLILRTA